MKIKDESFPENVARELTSLCSDFGFRETQRSSRMIRFNSDKVSLTFTYTRYNEVEFSFGRISDQRRGKTDFSLFDLLYSVSPNMAAGYKMRSATTAKDISAAIFEIASALRTHGSGLLSCDEMLFQSFWKSRDERQESYQDETVAAKVRPDAEKAFKAGDYATAVRLYRSISKSLTEVERRKLALAQSRIVSGRDPST